MKSLLVLPAVLRTFVDSNNSFVPHSFKIRNKILSCNSYTNTRVIWGVLLQRCCYQQSQVKFQWGLGFRIMFSLPDVIIYKLRK
jgi:hypothetical protein